MILLALWLYLFGVVTIWRRGIGPLAIIWPVSIFYCLLELAAADLEKPKSPELSQEKPKSVE